MPQSTKDRQDAYRARQAMLGLKEVRGVFLPEHLHQALKDCAQKLLEQHGDAALKAAGAAGLDPDPDVKPTDGA